MTDQTNCIRCGKQRIVGKTWHEKVGRYDIVHTDNVCADADCQKEVEVLLKDRHDIFANRLAESLKRRKENVNKSAVTRRANLLLKETKKPGKKTGYNYK